MQTRVRFAPSPTGSMHIGNLRTALYGYLFARKTADGKFILRIEDTDQERYVEGAVDTIYRTLSECGLTYDEGPDKEGACGPYVQSQRMDMYLPYAKQLIEQGNAYYCFCTNEELEQMRADAEAAGDTFKYNKKCLSLTKEEAEARIAAGEEYVIRLNTPTSGQIGFDDAIFGHIEVDCSDLDDMILIKSDGMPTYNFANVIDDHLMGISHVLRGSEYLSSTPKYNIVYRALGWEPPIYVHLPLIMRDAHHKLSKRMGDPGYQDLKAQGYLPEAIINYIALLGWNEGNNQEIYSMEELIAAFSLEGISKSPSIFDIQKLAWMNGEYIKKLAPEAFHQMAMPWYEEAGVQHMDCRRISELLQTRVTALNQIPQMVEFLAKRLDLDKELYVNKKQKTDLDTTSRVLPVIRETLAQVEDWTESGIHDAVMGIPAQLEMKNGQVFWPMRIAISSQMSTPGGAMEIAYLLGKDETLRRLDLAISEI